MKRMFHLSGKVRLAWRARVDHPGLRELTGRTLQHGHAFIAYFRDAVVARPGPAMVRLN